MHNDPRKIIRLLAEGVNPITGEILPNTSPYNHPAVIRALFGILEEPVAAKPKKTRDLPPMHGKAWQEYERAHLAKAFKLGVPESELAKELQRTPGSIRSELVRQGLIILPQTETTSA